MAEFFRTSTTWVIDFRYDGSRRQWFRTFGSGVDADADAVASTMSAELLTLHGGRAVLAGVRRASADEESAWLRGEEAKNVACPTGRSPRQDPGA